MGQAGAMIEATPVYVDADELALLQTSLSAKLTTPESSNTEIVELTPEAQLEEEIGRADEHSERIQRTLLKIRKALKTPTSRITPPRDSPPATSHDLPRRDSPTLHPLSGPDTSAAGGGAVGSGKVKLPKISLPRFDGDPVKWTSFWDSYQSAIHLNSELYQVDKFNYL